MRMLGKQTSARKKKTSAGLKITFVDLTYPGQRPELPSPSRHFLLLEAIEIYKTMLQQARNNIQRAVIGKGPFQLVQEFSHIESSEQQ